MKANHSEPIHVYRNESGALVWTQDLEEVGDWDEVSDMWHPIGSGLFVGPEGNAIHVDHATPHVRVKKWRKWYNRSVKVLRKYWAYILMAFLGLLASLAMQAFPY